jgi:hypothetical protein
MRQVEEEHNAKKKEEAAKAEKRLAMLQDELKAEVQNRSRKFW